MNSTLLIFSGGLDSTVLLYQLLEDGDPVVALSFDYGQRHKERELSAARQIAIQAKIPHGVVTLPIRDFLRKGSQTGDVPVPDGHYNDESMKTTVVPNRNMIMLAIAAGHAIAEGYDRIAYAAHAGDHTIYPDCRPQFVNAMRQAIRLADWTTIGLYAPFLKFSKAKIVRLGMHLSVPFALTYSCYKGGERQCGSCGTCVERREAFALAEVDDPTEYAS